MGRLRNAKIHVERAVKVGGSWGVGGRTDGGVLERSLRVVQPPSLNYFIPSLKTNKNPQNLDPTPIFKYLPIFPYPHTWQTCLLLYLGFTAQLPPLCLRTLPHSHWEPCQSRSLGTSKRSPIQQPLFCPSIGWAPCVIHGCPTHPSLLASCTLLVFLSPVPGCCFSVAFEGS